MRRHSALLLVSMLSLGLLAAGASGASAAPKKGSKPGLGAGKVMPLIQLRHPRGLNHFVRQVSDPSSPRYRDYATVESLVARFGATEKQQKQVLGWLAARGVRGAVAPTGTFVTASLGARRAARLLPAGEGALASAAGGSTSRAVPAALRGAVSAISVSDGSPAPGATESPRSAAASASAQAKKKGERYGSIVPHSGTAGGCAAGSSGAEAPGLEPFTPNQYLTAYGHAKMHARGFRGEGQTVAVVEQGGFKRSDIVTFGKCFGVKPPPISVQAVNVNKRPGAEDETTLDLEQLTVAAPGLDHIYVYEGGENSLENIILAAGTALGDPAHRPDVISISLGLCEPQIANALAWRDALDDVFAVAGGAGISVLVSAGDQGSTGCRGHFAETGETTALPLQAVELPSSSPYATAVGGTNLVLSKKNTIKEEIVWNDSFLKGKGDLPIAGGGGGGVSIVSPRTPWWQTGITRYGPGRKVPDVAALADRLPGYAYYCTAKPCVSGEEAVHGWSVVGGTSAAAPLTAAGVALANQYAAKRGEPNLGFLNPLIYQLGASAKTRQAAFHDVTRGDNNITPALDPTVSGDIPVDCCQAKPGYDWASGWGSLKMPALAKLAAGAYR
ncbi:MAG: protease pro-enzyme activation domain-containing protein [Solirubrobacterales bacterium]